MKYGMFFIAIEIMFICIFQDILFAFEELYILLFLLYNSIAIIFLLYSEVRGKLFLAFCIAYFLRLILMFLDIYYKASFFVPYSGSDTEKFYLWSVLSFHHVGYFEESPTYSKLLTLLYYIFSDNRIIAQYTNVIIGMGIIVYFYKILKFLKIEKKVLEKVCIVFSLLPNLIIFSAILLRENIIILLLTMSFYYFCQWLEQRAILKFVYAQMLVLLGIYFHVGVMGVFFGYFIIFSFYSFKQNKMKYFSIKGMLILSGGIIVIMSMFYLAPNIYEKISWLYEAQSRPDLQAGNVRDIGSLYLTWLPNNGIMDLFWQAPIRTFYFQFSPMIWDFRNITDVIAFLGDVIPVIICIYYAKKIDRRNNVLFYSLLVCILLESLVFGMGTQAAGTAIRHRNKYVMFYFILLALGMHQKVKKE